jgi:hypothetical protein
LGDQKKKFLTGNSSSIREPVTGSDYVAMVTAQSRTMAKYSHEIVDAIHGTS